jgi:hypothetical protein
MTSAVLSQGNRVASPPNTVKWAVFLSVALFVEGLFILFPPFNDGVPGNVVVPLTVVSVATLVVCWWVWKCRRWAAIVLTAITGFNLLTGIPPLLDPPNNWVIALVIVGIVPAVLSLWLLWHPDSRRAYRSAS